MKNKILIISMFSMFTLACGMPNKSKLDFSESASSELNPDEEISFAQIKSGILNSKCISCHSNVATEAGLKDWISAGNPEASPFFVKTENGSMPKGGTPLSTRDLEMIKIYITQMGKSPAPTPKPTPSPSPTPSPKPTPEPNPGTNPGVTFAEVKDRILTEYRCTSCHSVGTEAALSKWLNKTTPTSSRFYTITKSGTMPENGTNVTKEDMDFILQYVKDYAARN